MQGQGWEQTYQKKAEVFLKGRELPTRYDGGGELAEERKEGVKGPFSMLGRGKGMDGGWHGEDVGRSRFSAGKERAEKSEAILPSSFKVTSPATSKRP